MAHHQKRQADAARRGSAIQSLLKMFNISTDSTVSTGEEDVPAEADEPPDDQLSPLQSPYPKDSVFSRAASKPSYTRRESLLTRAIQGEPRPDVSSPLSSPLTSRGLSTTSSHSTGSMPSTAELTSDGDMTSPNRSATPSPPLPAGRFHHPFESKTSHAPSSKILIAPVTKDDKPTIVDVGEAAVEKTLGRKRCIMFACGGESPEKKASPLAEKSQAPAEPPKRKSMISFACPMRRDSPKDKHVEPAKPKTESSSQRKPSPAPVSKRRLSTETAVPADVASPAQDESRSPVSPASPTSPHIFHEFGSSQDETDTWVREAPDHKSKLTLSDCMKKENAIRQIGKEAEEEADEEEREQEELEAEIEEEPREDDFAPSDDSDAGNESDDEGGFAESDDESDAGSDYQFWAPSTTTAATSTDNLKMSHFSLRNRSRASSFESTTHSTSPNPSHVGRPIGQRRASKIARMRPGTPELPDSTDFVCGTLDEDRPLEAAFIACREQKKREKHIPIPQDIDPSFPTTDPEDNDDEAGDEHESLGAPAWLNDGFAEFDNEHRGRMQSGLGKSPAPPSPKQTLLAPRPIAARRTTPRSPPPKRAGLGRSPPPRKLFGHSPSRLRSPPPQMRLRSPPGSPATVIPSHGVAFGHLGQRPVLRQGPGARTASLPRTPNPFFRNFKVGSMSISNVASGAVSPAAEEPPKADLHVRGPVDIVMGLEKKRQKRKDKFWRNHCRKAAKEQAERKAVPGRGAERMKELGLECAERNRGYGLGQQQLVISL